MSWQDYLILSFLFLAESTLQRTSSTASVYLPCSINLFFRFIRKATISFLSFVFIYIYMVFFCFHTIHLAVFIRFDDILKRKFLSNMQKRLLPKTGQKP